MTERSVIIWPKLVSKRLCVRLINFRRTWMTTQRGDAVLLTNNEKTERHYVDSIELDRVHPAGHIGRTVKCAKDWLDVRESNGGRGGQP